MPTLHALDIPITVRFQGSFHLGTGQGEGLADQTVRRSASGAPYVPGSALKGALRQTAERAVRTFDAFLRDGDDVPDEWRLGVRRRGAEKTGQMCRAPRPEAMCQSTDPCLVCRLFGNTYSGRRLIVDDAYADRTAPETKSLRALFEDSEDSGEGTGPGGSLDEEVVVRKERSERASRTETVTRLRMDRRRQGAKHAALFTTEYAQAHTPFRSQLSGEVPLTPINGEGPPAELVLLAATLRATDQIGGEASAGRGECDLQVESTAEESGGGAEGEPALRAGGRAYSLQQLLAPDVLESLVWSEVDM